MAGSARPARGPGRRAEPGRRRASRRALYATGRFEASVAAWEELHARAVADDDPLEAARTAAWVALYLMMDSGLMSPVRGWLRRAERALEGRGEVAAHALISLVRTYERLMSGDMAAAGYQAALAIERGERHGVDAAVVIGRVGSARVRMCRGEVEAGLQDFERWRRC